MSLETPTTEMVSLQVFVGQSKEILASKSIDADQCRAPGETTDKKFPKIGVDFGPEGGVDLAWIFWGGEKRAQKIRDDFGTKFATKFVAKLVTKFVPVPGKT